MLESMRVDGVDDVDELGLDRTGALLFRRTIEVPRGVNGVGAPPASLLASLLTARFTRSSRSAGT